MRIGLFGGSFDPPHEGHQLVAFRALRRLDLHAVWWLVSIGNPHKGGRHQAAYDVRRRAVEPFFGSRLRHRSVDVESRWKLAQTVNVVRKLRRRCRGVRFVWIMGADNLRSFHRWHGWRELAAGVRFAVVDRSGETCRALGGRFACQYRRARSDPGRCGALFEEPLPRWVFLAGRRVRVSSTALRRNSDAWRAHR